MINQRKKEGVMPLASVDNSYMENAISKETIIQFNNIEPGYQLNGNEGKIETHSPDKQMLIGDSKILSL